MILGNGGYAYAMDGYVCCDTYVPPVQYTLNIGGDPSYMVTCTARYNGVDTYPTGTWTAARTLPVYAGSTVTAKLSNKSAYYRYNLSHQGLSATASSRDSAYTYLTGIVTGNAYVSTGTLSQNKFTATATEMTVRTHYWGITVPCRGGLIFRKSACTYPDLINHEEEAQNVKYTVRWSPYTSATGRVDVTTFSSPILSGNLRYTATLPYLQSTNSVTSNMSWWTNDETGANDVLSTFEVKGGSPSVRTATVSPTSNLPTSTPFVWWEMYSRGDNYATWRTADFTVSAILTGLAY